MLFSFQRVPSNKDICQKNGQYRGQLSSQMYRYVYEQTAYRKDSIGSRYRRDLLQQVSSFCIYSKIYKIISFLKQI